MVFLTFSPVSSLSQKAISITQLLCRSNDLCLLQAKFTSSLQSHLLQSPKSSAKSPSSHWTTMLVSLTNRGRPDDESTNFKSPNSILHPSNPCGRNFHGLSPAPEARMLTSCMGHKYAAHSHCTAARQRFHRPSTSGMGYYTGDGPNRFRACKSVGVEQVELQRSRIRMCCSCSPAT